MGKIDYQAIYNEHKDGWKKLTDAPQRYEAFLAGHYSDSNHFIYELLQNAEDARAKRVAFAFYVDRLVFYHDGKPFDRADVVGVSSVLEGTKDLNSAQTIGHFGMGFKSVFKHTCRPEIYSDDEAFAIENYLLPVELKEGWEPQEEKTKILYSYGEKTYHPFQTCTHLTKIVIPFRKRDAKGKIIDISGEGILEKLESLSDEILLFLKSVKDLYWKDFASGKTVYIKLRFLDRKHELIACRYRDSLAQTETTRFYLKYKRIWDHPKMKMAEIAIAYRLNAGRTSIVALHQTPIWVYFPTRDMTELPFLIHGSFETEVSREKLMTVSGFNEDLFAALGDLIADAMDDLAARKLISQDFLRSVVMCAFDAENEMPMGLKDKITKKFREARIVPDAKRNYYKAAELALAVPHGIAGFRETSLWEESFKDVPPFVAVPGEHEAKFNPYFLWLKDDLGIRLFDLSDWAKKLCELPERRLVFDEEDDNTEEKESAKEELMKMYDFLLKQWDDKNIGNTPYRAAVYECSDTAWEHLRKAPLVLNMENTLSAAWKNEEAVLYLEAENKYHKLAESVLVHAEMAGSYGRLFEGVFRLVEFDDLQFVKEEHIAKYCGDAEGLISFKDEQDWEREHCEDIWCILCLMQERGNAEEIRGLLKSAFLIKVDGVVRFAKPSDACFTFSDEGVNMEIYSARRRVDEEFYSAHGISRADLKKLGVITRLVDEGKRTGRGQLEAARNANWKALGDYCPLISIEGLFDNTSYIKWHPEEELAKKKSAEVLRLLLLIHKKLAGSLEAGKVRPVVYDGQVAEPLERVRDEAWLYDGNSKLRRIPEISRHDLDRTLYGDLLDKKEACETLGFMKNERDRLEGAKEIVSSLDSIGLREILSQVDPEVLQMELRRRNIPVFDSRMESEAQADDLSTVFNPYTLPRSTEFPQRRVRNKERLVNHIKMDFFLADPIRYETKLRQIRVSSSPKKIRQYISDMYTNNSGTCICQMCKQEADDFEATEIANLGVEMEPLHLCLCPGCAAQYRGLRDGKKESFKAELKDALQNAKQESSDGVWEALLPGDRIICFTETHLAEVQAILSLLEEHGVPNVEA